MDEDLPNFHQALGEVEFKGLQAFSCPLRSPDISLMHTSTTNGMRPVHIMETLNFPIFNARTCKGSPQELTNAIL